MECEKKSLTILPDPSQSSYIIIKMIYNKAISFHSPNLIQVHSIEVYLYRKLEPLSVRKIEEVLKRQPHPRARSIL